MSKDARAFVFFGGLIILYVSGVGWIVSGGEWRVGLIGDGIAVAALALIALFIIGKAWVDDGPD